jgi:type II secretion system protein N
MKMPVLSLTNPVHRLVLQIAAYVGFFLAALVFFIYLFFPFNRWKDDIEDILLQRTGKTFTIEKVEGWRLIGIKLKGVTILSDKSTRKGGLTPGPGGTMGKLAGTASAGVDAAPSGTKEGMENKEGKGAAKTGKEAREKTVEKTPEGTVVDSVAVRPALLPLLTGKKGVVFDVEIYGGEIDGKVTFGKKTVIDVDLDDLDLRAMTFLENLLGLPFLGEVNGRADLEYSGKNAIDAKGTIKLKIADMQIGDRDSKLDLSKAGGGIIKGAIKFEPVEIGDLVVKLSGEGGRLRVLQMEAASRHIEIKGGGELKINQPISMTMLNLYVKFKFKDEYIESSAMTKSVFSTLDRLTKFRQAKRTDGFWGFAIRGALSGGIRPIPAKVGPDGM